LVKIDYNQDNYNWSRL